MAAPEEQFRPQSPPMSPPPTVNLDSILPNLQIEEQPDEAAPLRVIAFDTQSTCAQLFGKQLSNHLRLGQLSHPYVLAATLGPERIHTNIGNEQTRRLWEGRAAKASRRVRSTSYEVATNDLLRSADKMETMGKTVFITEYPPFVMDHNIMRSALSSNETVVSKLTNPTIIPDELLKLLTPIIFIQHPAIVIPAWLRLAQDEYGSLSSIDEEDFTVWTSLRWSRMLFDYLRSTNHLRRRKTISSPTQREGIWEPGYVATKPYIIDAADVVSNTHAMLAATCRLLGIQYADVSHSWSRYFEYAASKFRKAVPSSFASAFSTSQQKAQSNFIDLDVAERSWEREFGLEMSKTLRRKVDEEMQHYLYLRNFKVRILPNLSTASMMHNMTGMPPRRASALPPTPDDLDRLSLEHPLRIVRTAITPTRRDTMASPVS